MKKQTVWVLASVFAVLVLSVALSRFMLSRPSLPAAPPIDLATVTKDSADRVVISSSAATLTLVKAAGVWRVGEDALAATAAPAQVSALFGAFGRARFERLVTRKADNPSAYGLTPKSSREVVVKAGETTIAAFLLGAPSDLPGSDYMQALGDTSVWVVSGDLRSATDPNPGIWRPAPSAAPTGAPPTAPPVNP